MRTLNLGLAWHTWALQECTCSYDTLVDQLPVNGSTHLGVFGAPSSSVHHHTPRNHLHNRLYGKSPARARRWDPANLPCYSRHCCRFIRVCAWCLLLRNCPRFGVPLEPNLALGCAVPDSQSIPPIQQKRHTHGVYVTKMHGVQVPSQGVSPERRDDAIFPAESRKRRRGGRTGTTFVRPVCC